MTIQRNCSLGEARISKCLDKLGVTYFHDITIRRLFKEIGCADSYTTFLKEVTKVLHEHEYGYSEKRIASMRFDFSLIRNNGVFAFIEYDGEQHFSLIDLFFSTLDDFFSRHDADRVKTALAESKAIPLLRIRFDQIDRIEYMIKDLLSNPQEYIFNHNTFLTNEQYWAAFYSMNDVIALATS